MKLKWLRTIILALTFILLVACQPKTLPSLTAALPSSAPVSSAIPPTSIPVTPTATPLDLSITLGTKVVGQGLSLDMGGDVDTIPVQVGNPAVEARQSGNGTALPSPDENKIADSFFAI